MAQDRLWIPIDLIVVALAGIVLVNLTVFVLYGFDKRKARMAGPRIPESSLLLAALCGPFGAACGMKIFHHKTRKLKFLIAVPAFVALQVAVPLLILGKII